MGTNMGSRVEDPVRTGTPQRIKRAGNGRQAGQSLAEFALVLPILLFTLSSMVDLAFAFYSYSSLGNAVRQGVRYGSFWNNANDDAAIRNHVAATVSSGVGVVNDASHIVVSAIQSATDTTAVPSGSRASGNLLNIEVHYDYTPISPMLPVVLPDGKISFTVSAAALID